MFGFLRNGHKEPARARPAGDAETRRARTEDKLPDRPSLDGYVVYELPEGVADLLVTAFRRRAA
jgi:hypothetical protein